jgi:hypothetical protein
MADIKSSLTLSLKDLVSKPASEAAAALKKFPSAPARAFPGSDNGEARWQPAKSVRDQE